MKIDIYTLLGMIKDGKAPKKILFNDEEWEWYKFDYKNKNSWELFDEYVITDILDNEVIILETTITYKPDKIVPLRIFDETEFFDYRLALNQTRRKINEIIDKLNKE